MKNNTLGRLGGMCSILVGISYALAGIAYLMVPAEQKVGVDAAIILPSFAQNPTMATLEYWAFSIGGVLGLAVVLAVSAKIHSANEGWVRWTSNLALVGFAVEALQYSRYLAYYPANAAAFVAGDATTKAAVAANHSTIGLDPNGWLVYGGVGVWILTINILALRENTWPKLLAYAGIIGGIAYGIILLGLFLQIELFVTIAAAAAVVIAPIWYIWMGLELRRSSA